MKALEARIAAMDSVLERELEGLKVVTSENKTLKGEIKELHSAFLKAEYEKEHGAGTWVDGDCADLYALDKKKESMPDKLATLNRKRLENLMLIEDE